MRLDLQKAGEQTANEFANAAEMMQWIQENESMLREYVGKQLRTADFGSNIENQQKLTG